MGYLEDIKNDRLKIVAAKQQDDVADMKYGFYEIGQYRKYTKLGKEYFFKKQYRDLLDEEKRRTFLVSADFEKQFKADTIEIFLKKTNNFRFFANGVFWHHKKRTKEELIWITSIVLDFDFKKDGSNRMFSPHEIAFLLHREFGYLPNDVWATRTEGNYQARYIINPMTGTEKSIYLFEAIAKRMAILMGADVVATSSVNLYTIPKSGFWTFSEEVHDISDFEWVLEDESIISDLKRKEKEKVISFTEKQIMNQEAIRCLMNVEFDSYRNHAAFTIALLFYALNKSSAEAYEFLSGEWFEKVNGPGWSKRFRLKEVKSTVKSAYSGKYNGPTKEWIYALTGIEFNYNLYKSSYIKKEISDGGYRSANQVQLKILEWLKDNDNRKIKSTELADALDIPRRSFIRNVKELKSNGFIGFESKTGPNGYILMKDLRKGVSPFVIEPDTSVVLDNLINYFEEEKVSI